MNAAFVALECMEWRKSTQPRATFQVEIEQKYEALGVPGVVWDCGRVCAYVSTLALSRIIRVLGEGTTRVLELGSGTGLWGITLAKLGFTVTLTDLAEAISLVERNVLHNRPLGLTHVIELDWRNEEDLERVGLVCLGGLRLRTHRA
jgi:2-polyprenyl-3-methyl-5-hydroxy-6-metoxy-1,4-benzoquinol methylase